MSKPIPPDASSSSSKRPLPSDLLDLTQGAEPAVKEPTPDAEDREEYFSTVRSDVVGVQYYPGLVGKGEYVLLRREPQNPYDQNAVQVINQAGTQVGHIPRAVASKLAHMMDGHLISVEGRMVGQNLDRAKHFKLAIDLIIYSHILYRDVIEKEMAWALQPAQALPSSQGTPKKGKGRVLGDGIGTSGSGSGLPQSVDPEMQQLLEGLRKVGQDERQADSVMDSLTSDIDVGKLPLHPNPPSKRNGQLKTDLLPHQSQALQWMISRENPVLLATTSDPAVQFWIKQDDKVNKTSYWFNVATRSPQKEAPVLGKGGIVADGMGLGKTLTVLALVLATKKADPTGGKQATLIVCPLSVVSNWQKQIRDHVSKGQLTYYVYHGANKEVTAQTLASYDVVITTYQSVASECPQDRIVSNTKELKKAKKVGALFALEWKRIVADEGHVLKNPKAQMTQAFAALEADRRWICTGTPIVNSPGDLGSLVTCLRLCKPLDQERYFKALLMRPLRNGDAAAGKLLQALVAQILLRRTKESRDVAGKKIVELPPIEFFQVPVQLNEDTRLLYDEVLSISQIRFEEALAGGGGSTSNVLSLLTRMRQLCLCRQLVPQSFFDELRQKPKEPQGKITVVAALSPEEREKLMEKLRRVVSDDEDCSICFSAPLHQPSITDCGHAYCLPCIHEWLDRDLNCPQCRHAITTASLLHLPVEDSGYVEPEDDVRPVQSAKINELIRYLEVFDAQDKTLVFSQFTSFLDLVAASLKEKGILFCRFDGSMQAKKREEVINTFQRPVTEQNAATNPRVMLISLKSGAVGLNLTAASNVFLHCDPWWQSAIEAQAVDRVHRMGQTKQVRVFQLIAENTIEAKVLEIQKRKDALVAKAFEKSSRGEKGQEKRQARFDELKELLGVSQPR